MEKLQFSIDIAAPRQKVWDVLWDDATYRKWTSVFTEGSHAETDWQEGSKVLFLDGKGAGMYSRIDRRVEPELMSIRHLGEIRDGVEQSKDDQAEDWEDATENYLLREHNGGTQLQVELDGADEYKDYFNDIFPKALAAIKALAEGGDTA